MKKQQAEADRREQQILQEVKEAMVEIGSIIARLPYHDQKRLLELLRIPGRVDAYGKLLEGCVACNAWTDVGGARLWRKLPEADIEALRELRSRLVST